MPHKGRGMEYSGGQVRKHMEHVGEHKGQGMWLHYGMGKIGVGVYRESAVKNEIC